MVLGRSEQFNEVVNRKPGLFQYVGKRRALNGLVRWNDKFQSLVGQRLVKSYVTASLSHDHLTISSESPNHDIVIQARNLGHTASSTTSASGAKPSSSSTGSR